MAPKKPEKVSPAQKRDKPGGRVSKARSNTSHQGSVNPSSGRQTRAMAAKAIEAGEQVTLDQLETTKRRRAKAKGLCEKSTAHHTRCPSNEGDASASRQSMASMPPVNPEQPATTSQSNPETSPQIVGSPVADVPGPVEASTPNVNQLQNESTGEPSTNAPQRHDSGPSNVPEFFARTSDDKEEEDRWLDKLFYCDTSWDVRETYWGTLEDWIMRVANIAFPVKCRWQQLDNATKAKLTAICPKAAIFVEKKQWSNARELFEAFIWRILYDNLFSPQCSDKWAGETWASFGRVDRSVRRKLKTAFRSQFQTLTFAGRVVNMDNAFSIAYHHSRTASYRMLYALHGPHTYPDRLAEILQRNLEPFTEEHLYAYGAELDSDQEPYPDSSDSSNSGEPQRPIRQVHQDRTVDLKERISKLCKIAVKIDTLMVSSKVNITMDLNDLATGQAHGFPFTEDRMKLNALGGPRTYARESAEGKSVDFVCTPLVRSWGSRWAGDAGHTIGGAHRMPATKFGLMNWQMPMTVVVDQYPGREVEGNN